MPGFVDKLHKMWNPPDDEYEEYYEDEPEEEYDHSYEDVYKRQSMTWSES